MKRIFSIIACVLGAFALVVFIYVSSQDNSSDTLNPARIVAALSSYRQELQATGKPLPESVTLDDLIRRGLLRQEEVMGFDGMKVTIPLTSADESQPQANLLEVTHPDGTKTVVQGDGSVQQATTARMRELLKNAQPKPPPSPPLPAP
jgi:hypothetical protein